MTKVRQLSKRNPLYIEKHAFWSAYHFALQYHDWKRQYAEAMAQTLKAVDYNDMPHGDLVDRTELLAEYDRQHVGPPGGARKIMAEAKAVIKGEGMK